MFDLIEIHDTFTFLLTNQTSIVTGKTATSIEMFNYADKKKRDNEGKLLGVNYRNWYDRAAFEKQYKATEDFKFKKKLRLLKKWVEMCIDNGDFKSISFEKFCS